jgi:hypothetical protein
LTSHSGRHLEGSEHPPEGVAEVKRISDLRVRRGGKEVEREECRERERQNGKEEEEEWLQEGRKRRGLRCFT